ncbi:unnamed protein product, partial [Owenia fusiformis]
LKMSASMLKFFRYISIFLISRYPFVNVVTLALLLGERAEREKEPPLSPNLIYGHMVMMVVMGCMMTFRLRRDQAATVFAGQMLYLAYTFFTVNAMKYNDWLRIRMSSRMVGVAGIFLLFGFLAGKKDSRNLQLKRLSEITIGVYILAYCYSIVNSPEDRKSFTDLIYGGQPMLYVIVTALMTCCLCHLGGFFIFDISLVLAITLSIMTLCIDCRVQYWTRKRGIDYWNQMRLIMDNVCVITGQVMVLTVFKRKTYTEEPPTEHGEDEGLPPMDAGEDTPGTLNDEDDDHEHKD